MKGLEVEGVDVEDTLKVLEQVEKAVEQAKRNMEKAAAELDFQAAAKYRDEMWALQQYLKVWKD